jgi:hypothetical protein
MALQLFALSMLIRDLTTTLSGFERLIARWSANMRHSVLTDHFSENRTSATGC